MRAHRKEWHCNSCRHAPFETAHALEDHFRHHHAGTFTSVQLLAVIRLCEVAHDRFLASACPLCNDWKLHLPPEIPNDGTVYATVAQFRRHLGKHLEQLALFSLPKASDDDPGSQDVNSNDAVIDECATSLSDLSSLQETSAREEDIRLETQRPESNMHDIFLRGDPTTDDLEPWFSSSFAERIEARKPFSQTDFMAISDALRLTGRESWGQIPRIYVTLRIIDQLPVIDDFLAQGCNDILLPFSDETLPASLRSQEARRRFLEAQNLVLGKALFLEQEDGRHYHFSNCSDIPVITVATLGSGSFSLVEKVRSRISFRGYARKLIPRSRIFDGSKRALREAEHELAILKKLSHRHIVKLVGSYTDPRFVNRTRYAVMIF